MNNGMHLVFIVLAGVIIADLVSNPKGTASFFSGLGKMFQIFTNPTNTKGL